MTGAFQVTFTAQEYLDRLDQEEREQVLALAKVSAKAERRTVVLARDVLRHLGYRPEDLGQ